MIFRFLFCLVFLLHLSPMKAQNNIAAEDTTIYQDADSIAEFPGGIEAMQRFIRSNLVISSASDSMKGSACVKVLFEFIVEKNGSLSSPQARISAGDFKFLEPDFVRLLQKMPPWKPALKNGKAVRSKVNMPINILLK